jgi:LmbE family N-acetylglucosaminyl deacetylase
MPGLLDRIARGDPIAERVVLVAAHPDDETLALASRLDRMSDLCIIHLTDGAPVDLSDARRAGAATREDYAELRRQEVRAAMQVLGCSAELRCYWHVDQHAILNAAAITQQLVRDIWDAHAVVTHPYEHGHPDHDAAALCVALARSRLVDQGMEPPEHIEFPSYHLRDGQGVFGAFWPEPGAAETLLPLTEEERHRRSRALRCFASQQAFLSQVPDWPERLRPAPAYDFHAPAAPREAFYDRLGWAMTSAVWRDHAQALLAA